MATYIIPHGVVYTNFLNMKKTIEKGDKVIDENDTRRRLKVLSVSGNLAVTHTSSEDEKIVPTKRLHHASYQSYRSPLFVDNCVIKLSEFSQSKLKKFYSGLVPPELKVRNDTFSPDRDLVQIDKESKWTNAGNENLLDYENHIRNSALYNHLIELNNRTMFCSCGDIMTCHGNILVNLFFHIMDGEPAKKKTIAEPSKPTGFLDGLDLEDEEEHKEVVTKTKPLKKTIVEPAKPVKPSKPTGFLDGLDLEEDEEEHKEVVTKTKPLKKTIVEPAETLEDDERIRFKDMIVDDDWFYGLEECLRSDQMKRLEDWLDKSYESHLIFPPKEQIFTAFTMTPLAKVKAVIIGQDPYHGPGQSHGLSFSVRNGCKVPPSLCNVHKELRRDGFTTPLKHGNLSKWANEGVLMLNTVLTVARGKANSHKGKWEFFTDRVIELVLEKHPKAVFMLWGKEAGKKAEVLPGGSVVLVSPHPSPLNTSNPFIGCGCFSDCNKLLEKNGQTEIDWNL